MNDTKKVAIIKEPKTVYKIDLNLHEYCEKFITSIPNKLMNDYLETKIKWDSVQIELEDRYISDEEDEDAEGVPISFGQLIDVLKGGGNE